MIVSIFAVIGALGVFGAMIVFGASVLNASDDELLDEKHEQWPKDEEP